MSTTETGQVRIRRVYDAPDGGYRVLVDRLWPRGVSKSGLELDEWCPAVAPSAEARRRFRHDPDRFAEFRERYTAELLAPGDPQDPDGGGRPALEALLARWAASRAGDLVLLYSARDEEHNQAVVLRDVLQDVHDGR